MELVDMRHLGCRASVRKGSSPFIPTKYMVVVQLVERLKNNNEYVV